MNTRKTALILTLVSLIIAPATRADDNLRVLPATTDGVKTENMMNHYLKSHAAAHFETWKKNYEQRTTPEQIAQYQKHIRNKFTQALGPFPERTPLNPQVTGIVKRKGYRVEKVIFESQPKHYVTALLFIPQKKKRTGPYPGVLVPCGHSKNGKAYETYQSMGALLALNGMVALVFDPIDQGERSQMPSKLPNLQGTRAHTMIGVGSILLGRNTASFEIWDGMRGIDYLQSRPEVDPNRIGCTGNSGGGTQTSYLMSLDDRIIAAAPSCYITNLYERILELGAQDAEQNIFGQLAFGMDHADYLMLRAPTPIMICAATKDFFDIRGTWQSFRYAKRLYSRMGYAERIDILENDAPHNYNKLARQSVIRWMSRWLNNKDKPITEPQIELLNDQETTCTPTGLTMELERARSTYDINRDIEKTLAEQRRKLWAENDCSQMLEQVRKLTRIRKLADIPAPAVEELAAIQRPEYNIRKLVIEPEPGIRLPALLFTPKEQTSQKSVLYLHQDGKQADAAPDGPIEKLIQAGNTVLAVDIRGTGETKQNSQKYFASHFGRDGQDVYTAYLLGNSYVTMRTEDILLCARFLRKSKKEIRLIAIGNLAVPALHAAALEPQLFDSAKLTGSLTSWSNIIHSGLSENQLINTVHAALTIYDLTDLQTLLENNLTSENPTDAIGKIIEADNK